MNRSFLRVILIAFFLSMSLEGSSAAQVFTLSGKITDQAGNGVSACIVIGSGRCNQTSQDGSYSAQVIESLGTVEISITINNYSLNEATPYSPVVNQVSLATFSTRLRITQDSILNLNLPKVIPVSITVGDFSGAILPNSLIRIYSSGGTFSSSGNSWNFTAYPTGNGFIFNNSGSFTLYIYETPFYMVGDFRSSRGGTSGTIPKIPMDKVGAYKVCALINLSTSNQPSPECYDEKKSSQNLTAAAEKAAAEKAAAEKAAAEKAAAEKAAAEKAAAEKEQNSKKLIKIKCIKGKQYKVITGTNPVCPKGFKKAA